METVIKVENLSKLYRIGAKEGYKTFRETLIDAAKAPFLLCKDIAKKAIHPFHSALASKTATEKNTIWALKDVSFNVNRGEVVGIIGRNGAGKSTLLKILSKITEPTEGRIELTGRVGSLLEVGTGFHPELTGHENAYLYGAILGMDRWEVTRKFDEIVAFAELEKFIDTPVKRYSSGMYMRLAFAVAAHLEPEILLVDEVLAVGDVAFQKKCLGKMGDVSKEGRTVLFVSHNMPAIENLCSRVYVLDKGGIVFIGDTRSGIETYTDLMTQKSKTPLSKRVDRTGSGAIRIESFQVLDSRGLPVEQLITGRDYIFRFGYRSEVSHVHDIDFGFAVRDSMNRVIFRNSTAESGIALPKFLPSQGYFDCEIPRIPLTSGKYAFGFRLVVNGEESDYIRGGYVAQFDVTEGDYFKTGKISSFAPMIVQHQWYVVSENSEITKSETRRLQAKDNSLC